jgi:hypothetical protein
MQPDKYKDYIMRDGSIKVEMDNLSYGYVEAAHYWYEELVKVFVKNKYKISKKDKCVFIRCKEGTAAFWRTTVDDCLLMCTRDDQWINEQILTVESGDEILIGMQIYIDWENKKVVITQLKHLERIIERFEVAKVPQLQL